jgi:hypothetical protein
MRRNCASCRAWSNDRGQRRFATGTMGVRDNLRRGQRGRVEVRPEPSQSRRPESASPEGRNSVPLSGTGYQPAVGRQARLMTICVALVVATVSAGRIDATDHGMRSWASLNQHREQHWSEMLVLWTSALRARLIAYEEMETAAQEAWGFLISARCMFSLVDCMRTLCWCVDW